MRDAFPRTIGWMGESYEFLLEDCQRLAPAVVGEWDPEQRESELEIQGRWFGGEFGKAFLGADGEEIEIVQWGRWNRGAGPDFEGCAVRVDGALRRGAIELDLDARDWERHGHGGNPEFNDVVLHVFTDGPSLNRFYTRTHEHRLVPQLQLPQYAWSQGPPDYLPEISPGRCVAPLGRFSDKEVESLLIGAASFRLREKSLRLRAMIASTSFEQAVFQALAEALGFHQNRASMAVLAQRCALEVLRALSIPDREALLLGEAGFLERKPWDSPDHEARRYFEDLRERWGALEEGSHLPSRDLPWRLSGNRPQNHPQRRIAALGAIVEAWDTLLPILECPSTTAGKVVSNHVNNFLNNLRHPFWSRRWTWQSA